MTEIQIINSMNQSIITKITEFKNKAIKKNDLNKFMLVNLCHILKTTNKIRKKNEEIQKKQEIEIKKSLSKIKSYHGNVNYEPNDLESIPIMKKLLNPTLETYIPISEISYTTEIQLHNKYSDKFNFNELILLKKNNKKEIENDDKEIHFEEPPITYIKNTINAKHILSKENLNNSNINMNTNVLYYNNCIEMKNSQENLFDLINKEDDEIFMKEENENQFNRTLFYELINSFDEDSKDEPGDDDVKLDFKKIESFFYLDEIVLNRRLSKRNSSDAYNNLSSTSSTSSFDSSRNTGSSGKLSIRKEIYENEFKNYITKEAFNKFSEQMNVDYLRYMLVIYSNAVSHSQKIFYCEKKMFINLLKAFILRSGISSKKLYDKIIQSLLLNKSHEYSFENFVKSFSTILKLKDDYLVLKYQFIMSLFLYGEEDINVNHINIFLQLIKGKLIYNSVLWDKLSHSLIKKYDRIYSYELGTNFKFEKILLCLESFFDKQLKINQN